MGYNNLLNGINALLGKEDPMGLLIGRKVERIFLNEQFLKFVTDKGNLYYTVYGDCCSTSVFYDFIGVKNILKNKLIKSIERIGLTDEEMRELEKTDKKMYQESLTYYGYRFITEDKKFGEVSSVLSFRNYSNGYYGGELELYEDKNEDIQPEIFDDVLETVENNIK